MVVLLGCCWPVVGLLLPEFDFELVMLIFKGLAGKTFSAPWSKVLWELLGQSFLHLRGLGHCLNMCLSRKQKKQLCFSHDLGSLRRSLFLKYTTLPKPMTALAYDSAGDSCWVSTVAVFENSFVAYLLQMPLMQLLIWLLGWWYPQSWF